MNFNSSYKLLLDDCNKYPLYVARIKRFIELVYKIAHDKCPIYLNDLIKPKNLPINLRSENDMFYLFHNAKPLHMVNTLLYIMHHIIDQQYSSRKIIQNMLDITCYLNADLQHFRHH